MKKVFLILSLLAFNINSSFAGESTDDSPVVNKKVNFDLAERLANAIGTPLTYQKLAFLEKSFTVCKVLKPASKDTDFVELLSCDTNGSGGACVSYIDKKTGKDYKPLPPQSYCFSNLEVLALGL